MIKKGSKTPGYAIGKYRLAGTLSLLKRGKGEIPACRSLAGWGAGFEDGDFDRGTVDQRIPSVGLRPATCRWDSGLRRFFFIGGLIVRLFYIKRKKMVIFLISGIEIMALGSNIRSNLITNREIMLQ